MIKKVSILCLLFLVLIFFISVVILGVKNLKIVNFIPASVIFILDTSLSNSENLSSQKLFIKQLCASLDSDDKIKIIKADREAYLIYEGSPQNTNVIAKSLERYTDASEDKVETALYGKAIKKAVSYSLLMKQENYIPSVVIVGNLDGNAKNSNVLDWDILPKNINATLKYIPEFSMVFAYGRPENLDFVKEKLNPVLGEDHLLIATDVTADKISRSFLNLIGR